MGTFVLNGVSNFKILYEGSGGGLMLCIMSINQITRQITLSALVTIGVNNIVDHCNDYSNTLTCLRCNEGYHLENELCYSNIQNCISYFQNICLQCSGYSLLVENSCISICSQFGDLSQIRFYGDFRYYATNSLPIISREYLLTA